MVAWVLLGNVGGGDPRPQATTTGRGGGRFRV